MFFLIRSLGVFLKKLKSGNSHSHSTIQSPIQSHTWMELNPHSYLSTFWAWSNIVAFWEMSWSSSTLVIHCARSLIKSIKSGSPKALHPPKKKSEQQSYSRKKKRTKGKDGEAKIKHHSKDIHPSHTCTWPSSKVTWPLKEKIFSYLKLHKSLSKSRRGFSVYLSETQIQKRD